MHIEKLPSEIIFQIFSEAKLTGPERLRLATSLSKRPSLLVDAAADDLFFRSIATNVDLNNRFCGALPQGVRLVDAFAKRFSAKTLHQKQVLNELSKSKIGEMTNERLIGEAISHADDFDIALQVTRLLPATYPLFAPTIRREVAIGVQVFAQGANAHLFSPLEMKFFHSLLSESQPKEAKNFAQESVWRDWSPQAALDREQDAPNPLEAFAKRWTSISRDEKKFLKTSWNTIAIKRSGLGVPTRMSGGFDLYFGPRRQSFDAALATCWREPAQFQGLAPEFQHERRIALRAFLEGGGEHLWAVTDRYAHDREVIEAAVTSFGDSLQYASDALKNDPHIARLAFENSEYACTHFGFQLKNNPVFLLSLLQSDSDKFLASQIEDHVLAQSPELRQKVLEILPHGLGDGAEV